MYLTLDAHETGRRTGQHGPVRWARKRAGRTAESSPRPAKSTRYSDMHESTIRRENLTGAGKNESATWTRCHGRGRNDTPRVCHHCRRLQQQLLLVVRVICSAKGESRSDQTFTPRRRWASCTDRAYAMLSRTSCPSSPNLSAMASTRVGRNVPSVSIYRHLPSPPPIPVGS